MWATPMRGRMLLFFGENGAGKTHVAKAVHRWVCSVGHGKTWFPTPGVCTALQSLFWHWPALLDELKGGSWDLVADCMNVPCLIIDELGGGHDPTGVGTDKLCQILSRREHMWTLITTNITADAWEAKFDRRVASRFFRNSTHVDLSDVPDYATV
jgi:DNA replication protein DnaC